jgi:hypothetical protein
VVFLDGKSWRVCGGFVVDCGLLMDGFGVMEIFLFFEIYFLDGPDWEMTGWKGP